ncbi:MAG TPA: hypothetical protein VGV90_12060, partial [Solirubrobacteraceae bacterium]|nr:hypothetical protein [Solirubrobacteraceae bacterium]
GPTRPPAPQRRSVAPGGGGTPVTATARGPSSRDELQPSANPRRSDVSAFLVRPDNLFLSAEDISRSLGIAVLLLFMLGLPTRLFNATVRHNRAELVAFFRPLVNVFAGITPGAARRALGFAGVSALVAAGVYLFLDPRFPNRPGAAPYALGMLIGVGVIITTRLLSARAFMARRLPGIGGGWVVYVGQIAVLAVCVAVSRLAHLAPGLLLGMAGDYESRRPLTPAQDAAANTVSYGVRLVVSLTAWFASIPVAHASEEVGASSGLLALDVALTVIALVGMQSIVFALMPLMFLDGYNLARERRGVWIAYWGTGVLWLALVVINPALSHQGEQEASVPWLAGLLVFQALIAVGLWAFFLMRRRTAAGRSVAHA